MRAKIAGLTLIGALMITSTTAYAQTTTSPADTAAATKMAPAPTMDLMGTKVTPKATGTSTIEPAGAGKWKIHVAAHGLPKPTALQQKPARTVYLLWVLADAHMKQMAVLTMKPGTKPGDFVGDGTVSLPTVHGLSITADAKAGQLMPTSPMVAVLETPMSM